MSKETQALALTVTNLHDDFSVFNNYCAFVCSAISALAEQLYDENDPALRGIQQETVTMKEQLNGFLIRLREVQRSVKELQ
jgi:hypothetical protein